jgi:hypothetical protein
MRKLQSSFAASAVIAGCLLIPTPACSEIVLEARQWAPDVSGQFRIDSPNVVDTIDLLDDLGLEDDEATGGRLLIRPSRRTLIRFGYTPLQLSGDQVVARTINFLGRDFNVSSRVVSDLDIEYGRIGFAWQFISSRDRRFRIGPIVEAKGFTGTATLAAPDLPVPVRESADFEVAFASAGLVLDIEANERFHVFAEGSVLVDDSEGEINEFEVGARYFFSKALGLVAGVRTLEIDAEYEGDLLQMDLDGAFAGLSLRF